MPEPSHLNELLKQQLLAARQQDQQTRHLNTSGIALEVPHTGKMVSSAYEQLRKAAEYSEEHLLLQRAIKRFFKRNLFIAKHPTEGLGTELIVELTQAGYLQGHGFTRSTSDRIGQLVEEYMAAHGQLRQAHIERNAAEDWVLAVISTATENLLSPHYAHQATVYVTYQHFLQAVSKQEFADSDGFASYELCLYIAVHQAILKSDIDIVRHELLNLYKQSPHEIHGFIHLNHQIDELFTAQLTQRLKRVVSRYGAPFRVLQSLIDSRNDVADILAHEQMFMNAYEMQIGQDYRQVRKRLNRGLIKSIVFIFITKVLIGLGIEIPYDLLTRGSVAIMPLAVNLLFPPLYMASLKLTLRLPSAGNKAVIGDYMQKLLYDQTPMQIHVPPQRHASAGIKLVYSILVAIPIVVTVLILQKVGFNIVQMVIFFVFFSTASFLGFRLSSLIRDFELRSVRRSGLLSSLWDFFYLPFILVGQWLSSKYSKLNLVARFLDIAIEMPLKAVLRLVRQWVRFLHEKHEELY